MNDLQQEVADLYSDVDKVLAQWHSADLNRWDSHFVAFQVETRYPVYSRNSTHDDDKCWTYQIELHELESVSAHALQKTQPANAELYYEGAVLNTSYIYMSVLLPYYTFSVSSLIFPGNKLRRRQYAYPLGVVPFALPKLEAILATVEGWGFTLLTYADLELTIESLDFETNEVKDLTIENRLFFDNKP